MTLILSATCNDGIVVCADKRRTVKTRRDTQYFDDLEKIYHFSDSQTLGFNHAINRIDGLEWQELLSKAETQIDFSITTPAEFVSHFEARASDRIARELQTNRFDDSVGFIFCFARLNTSSWIRELYWRRGHAIERKTHAGLIRTGNGARYLDDHLASNLRINTVEYWYSLTVDQAIPELQSLFETAVATKHKLNGSEFSDCFDVAYVRPKQEA